ncbi:hypothetical protein AAMO2058_000749900 [Amorphochlora amoebiformis]
MVSHSEIRSRPKSGGDHNRRKSSKSENVGGSFRYQTGLLMCVVMFFYKYYQTLLSDVWVRDKIGGWGEKDFRMRLQQVSFSFIIVAAAGFVLLAHFFPLAVVVGAASAVTILIPLTFYILGKAWMNFCSYISQLVTGVDKPKIRSPRLRKRDIAFVALQILLCMVTLCASVVSGMMSESQLASLIVSIGCFISLSLVSFGTHGGAGKRVLPGYRFYMPFEGGAFFCVLQASAWVLFSLSFLLIGLHSGCTILCLIGRCSECVLSSLVPNKSITSFALGAKQLLVPATSTAVIAEFLLISSFWFYTQKVSQSRADSGEALRNENMNSGDIKRDITETNKLSSRTSPISASFILIQIPRSMAVMFFIVLAFKPEFIVFALAYLLLEITEPYYSRAAVIWIVFWMLYATTYRAKPASSGRRSWPAFQRIFSLVCDYLFSPYFNLEIVRDSDEPFPPATAGQNPKQPATGKASRYIFGYHPHGIIPIASQWTTMTNLWKEKFPGILPVTLVSSIIHTIPFMRDLAQWTGGYEITREGFRAALYDRGAVLLVPGGQEEMIGSRSDCDKVPIVTSHKGFVRIALSTGASLVPTYAFGETQTFDNIPAPEDWQRWCVRIFRANLICYPYGYGPLLPRPVKFCLVVGKPIDIPKIENPDEASISYYQTLYFNSLKALFDKYKKSCGRARDSLVFMPPLSTEPKLAHPKESNESDRKEGINKYNFKSSKRKRRKKGPKVNEGMLVSLVVFSIFGFALALKSLGL